MSLKCLEDKEIIIRVPRAYPYEGQELIRCKDCKYWDTDHEGTDLMFCHISDWIRLTRGAEDYCSKAERKEE